MEIRGMREAEIEAMIGLQCLTNRPDGHERYTRYIRGDSSYELDQTRVVVVGGRIVSTLRVWDRQMRIGPSAVRTGGIGGVCTHPEHRKKGYASAMMRDAIEWLRQSGYEVGVLFSEIPFVFYRRLGWECLPQAGFHIKRQQVVGLQETDWQIEPFEEELDLEDAAALYDVYNARQSGAILRPRFHWDTAPARIRDLFPTVVARRGNTLGGFLNFLVEGTRVNVLEVAYERSDPTILAALANHLLRCCEQEGIEEIEGEIPHRHPLVDVLVRGSVGDLSLTGKTSMMLYAVNLLSLMQKVLPELQVRLDASGQRFAPVSLRFEINEQQCALRLNDSGLLEVLDADPRAASSNLPGESFWRLLLGESSWSQLEPGLQAQGISTRPEVAALMPVLFPPQEVTFWGTDHF